MEIRFAQNAGRRRWIAGIYIVLFTAYLGWRFTILNPDSMTLSLVYFLAEVLSFILGLNIIAVSQNYQHQEPPPAPPGLSVDVFVLTYKEKIEIIRRTVLAARNIQYPHQTIILDDGRRDEVMALAQELGVTYRSRPQNIDAKAGNLNFGFADSKADFVMVFDADHIAMPHALDTTLGFFADDNVTMVQTPQDYYNIDAFQYMNSKSGGLWHDQSFFYYIAQPCRDFDNGASCVGTGVVYRRTAVDAIGGIPRETVTEDLHTSLKMHKKGQRVIYLNEPVSYGVAESELREYYKTRQRWAHGNLHALQREKILTCKGLTLKQRIAYLSMGLVYLEGWQQLLQFMIPIGALVFGLQPFKITIFNILVVFLFPFFNYGLLQEIGCGFAQFWANEIFAMARWPVYLLSTAGLFGRPLRWRSSKKILKAHINWKLMLPQASVLILSLGALIFGAVKLNHDFRTGPVFDAIISLIVHGRMPPNVSAFDALPHGYTFDLVAVAGFWALYNVLSAAFFMAKTIRNALRSNPFFRFNIPMAGRMTVSRYPVRISCISETWVCLSVFKHLPETMVGSVIAVTVFLPAGPIELPLKIERLAANKYSTEIEGRWVWDGNEQRDALSAALYSVDWHHEFLNRHAYFKTPLDVVGRLFSFWKKPPPQFKNTDWQAVLFTHGGIEQYGVLARNNQSKSEAALICFSPMAAGQGLAAQQFTPSGLQPVSFTIMAEQPIASLVQAGLDGAVVRRYTVSLTPVAPVISKPHP